MCSTANGGIIRGSVFSSADASICLMWLCGRCAVGSICFFNPLLMRGIAMLPRWAGDILLPVIYVVLFLDFVGTVSGVLASQIQTPERAGRHSLRKSPETGGFFRGGSDRICPAAFWKSLSGTEDRKTFGSGTGT